MKEEDYPCKDITEAIIAAAFEVSNTLGCGFLEKVYENALAAELRHCGLDVATQVPIRVVYREETVGDYQADMIVNRSVLVEVKATEAHHDVFMAQVLNYLRATKLPVGLLLNFGQPRLWYKRLVSSADWANPGEGT
jgi:GxxExxY protein